MTEPRTRTPLSQGRVSHAVTLVCSASGGALSPGARSWALQPAVEDRAGVLCPLCASRVLPDRGSRRDENATAAALLSSTLRRRGRGPQHRGQHGGRVTAACRAWAPADSSRHGRHREQEAWPYTGGGSLHHPSLPGLSPLRPGSRVEAQPPGVGPAHESAQRPSFRTTVRRAGGRPVPVRGLLLEQGPPHSAKGLELGGGGCPCPACVSLCPCPARASATAESRSGRVKSPPVFAKRSRVLRFVLKGKWRAKCINLETERPRPLLLTTVTDEGRDARGQGRGTRARSPCGEQPGRGLNAWEMFAQRVWGPWLCFQMLCVWTNDQTCEKCSLQNG